MVYQAEGIGHVYHVRTNKVVELEDDAPPVDIMNDEGEEDEVEVPSEIWLARSIEGREVFTKHSLEFAKTILSEITGNQYDLFA